MNKLDNIKALIEENNRFDKPNILIISQIEDCIKVIRNLFDKDFETTSIGPLVAEINKIDLEKDVNISYSDDFNIKLNKKEINNLDYTIVCISCINKRFKEEFLELLKGFTQKIKKLVFVLTDIEFLDERELGEIKEFLKSKLKEVELLTIMDIEYRVKDNQTSELIKKIAAELDKSKLISFYKSQSIETEYIKEFAIEITSNYKNVLEKLDNNINENEFKYINIEFAKELVQAYGFRDKDGILTEVVVSNIEKILEIRRAKVRVILEDIEKKKQEELERLEAERVEKERIKAEKEREEREKLEAEEKRRQEEERKRIEKERIEKERLEAQRAKEELEAKKREELRLEKERAEQKKREERLKAEKLAKELEVKRLAEEKAKREKEKKAKIIEEKLKEEKERIKKELERNRKEEEKKHESKKRINEEIKRINRITPKAKDIDNEVIIEASFTVDDFDIVDNIKENYVNEIEVRIDSIIEEVIESKMNEIIIEIKKEIKEKLKANNII